MASRVPRQAADNDSTCSNLGSIPHSRSSREDVWRNSFEGATHSREVVINALEDPSNEQEPSASNAGNDGPSTSSKPKSIKGKGKALASSLQVLRKSVHALKDGLSMVSPVPFKIEPMFRWTIPFEPNTNNEALKLKGQHREYHRTFDGFTSTKGRNEINNVLDVKANATVPVAPEVYVDFCLKSPFQGQAIHDAELCFTILSEAGAYIRPGFNLDILYKHEMDPKALEDEQYRVKRWLNEIATEKGCEFTTLWRDLAR